MRYEYMILTQSVAGSQEEFERWYDEVHLDDVMKIPGIVSAKRFHIQKLQATGVEVPSWCSLAIYGMETDDPETVLAAMRAVAGTTALPLSETFTPSGMIEMIAQVASERGCC